MYSLGIAGLNLIKSFEGCRLKAYKPVAAEKYYTIGYGHYGPDVSANMTITQAQADAYLVADCNKFVNAVNKYANLPWMNQNRFDALVSFTYNCGSGNLDKLLKNGTRTVEQVANSLPAYNKGSGKVLAGLVRRRQAELDLFNTPVQGTVEQKTQEVKQPNLVSDKDIGPTFVVGKVYTTTVNLNVRTLPGTNYKILKTYPKGTRFTCKQVFRDGKDIWVQTPSGYIAVYYNGKTYAK